jgi:glycosyltransferase involved in cell wall biosynthesis
VWVGRLEAPKDPVLAARTLSAVRAADPDVRAVLVGDGALAAEVRATASGSGVELVPRLDRAELADLLRRAGALLMTSRFEGAPRIVVESLASGTPLAYTPESDPERLAGLVTGVAPIATREPRDLAARVLELLASGPALVDTGQVADRTAAAVLAGYWRDVNADLDARGSAG